MVRIGMIAPITHPYPPPGYGPWERVTHDLTEQLVRDGHDVTLFASAASQTEATLVATVDEPVEALPPERRRESEDRHIRVAVESATSNEVEVLHSHLHVHVLRHADRITCPLVTTLHGSAWNAEHHETLRRHSQLPFVSISDKERDFLPELNYLATIPNGVRVDEFPPGEGSGDYLVFVGRMAPEKAPHLAVEVAKRAGRPMLMAGVIEDVHRGYATSVLDAAGGDVDFLGPLNRPELSLLLGDAAGLVMPLLWDEPFGLVVVEAFASGTPVIAWRRGAMPEIVEDGVTGFLVDDVEGGARAVSHLSSLRRSDCVHSARSRFSDASMAHGYASVYEDVIQDIA
jgi:glycosyltransferase involved in cell wall biosynthesis